MGLLEGKPEHEGEFRLDRYLVPILRKDEIEQYAEEIWAERCPEAANDQKLRRPYALAERMGLSVLRVPLYRRSDTRGILFFRGDTVLIHPEWPPGQKDDPPPAELQVDPNTIVINTRTDGGLWADLDIYHECIHYEWHYLFYRLQDMQNNDLKQLKKVRRVVVRDKGSEDPTAFKIGRAHV